MIYDLLYEAIHVFYTMWRVFLRSWTASSSCRDRPRVMRVGWGGDVTLSPPFVLVTLVAAGFVMEQSDQAWSAPMFRHPLFVTQKAGSAVTVVPWTLRIIASTTAAWTGLRVKRRCDAALAKAGTTADFTPVPSLAVTGPYATCRNPLYWASLALPAALGLLADTAWVAVGSNLALWLYFDCVLVPAEERFLTQQLGEEYVRYCSKVKRWGWF